MLKSELDASLCIHAKLDKFFFSSGAAQHSQANICADIGLLRYRSHARSLHP